MISYILVTSPRLADEKAFVYLRSLSAQLYETNAAFKKNPQSIDSLQQEASKIIAELQQNFDKTASAQSTLDSVADKMRGNISKMFDNSAAVNEMDVRADGLKNSALDF